jgi:hypothetical protein
MSRYEGRILKATPPTVTSSSASGIWSSEEVAKYSAAGTWPKQQFGDPDFANTVLLLHGDGTNGAQNNTFLDSSANNFTVTRGGSSKQGTFSPFSKPEGKWGCEFGGSSDSLRINQNSAFQFGTGDFEIACWIYPTDTSGLKGIWTNGGTSNGTVSVYIDNGVLKSWIYGDSPPTITNANVPANEWSYITVSRVGTTYGVFINDTLRYSYTTSANITQNFFVLGDVFVNYGGWYKGFMSNFRVVKGYGVSSVTVPTEPLTAITGTSALMCQSNRLVDNSANNFSITKENDVFVTPFSPYFITSAYDPAVNGGSVRIDQTTGDHLTMPAGTAFAPGTGDFTVDGWFYHLVNTGFMIYSQAVSGNTYFGISFDSANKRVVFDSTPPYLNVYSGTVGLDNAWNHFSVTRASGVMTVTCNGVAGTPVANAYNYTDTSMTPTIGSYSHIPGGSYTWGGYISNFRYVKGTAIPGTTVPTAPTTAVSGTSALLNFTNSGILDNTMFNNIQTVGNSQVDTTTKQFGTGSMEFDGTGDYLKAAFGNNFDFGTGPFTVEFWLYLNATTNQCFLDLRTGSPFLFDYSSNALRYFANSTVITGSALSTGQWYHIALTRDSSSNNRMFVDGTQTGSTVSNSTNLTGTTIAYIGANYGGNDALNGFIDDLRIIKGVAKYTTSFTPPVAAFKDLGE